MTIIAINVKEQGLTVDSVLDHRIDGINTIGTFSLDGNFRPQGDGEILMIESSNPELITSQSALLTENNITFITGVIPERVCSEISGLPINTDQMMEPDPKES
jgi:hypothetical protein